MKVCLLSPPTVTEFEEAEVAECEAVRIISEHAPIGTLSLAAVLEQKGIDLQVVDLNRSYYAYLRDKEVAVDFCSFVSHTLEKSECDVFGFSTICSSYPLTIRIAQEVKRTHPASAIVLGGPQASVVDVQTMRVFEFIDYILRGEAEDTFPSLLDVIGERPERLQHGCTSIPGLTFRTAGKVVRNPAAQVILDLDRLPMPSFHLYPELKTCHYVPLELGRGCPFACTFCSTNDFFRRRFRLKSAEKMIEQMTQIKRTYGIDTFDLIHDMFTVDRKRVVGFCEALLTCPEKFYWNCSARTDCIDDELIALMAEAGCRGIFFGIETGSPRIQKSIGKNLDLSDAALRIESADRHKISTTASLITGFPDENESDLKETVGFLMDSMRFDHTDPQLHILAPLAGTPIHERYGNQLRLDDIMSDMSFQGWRQDPADRALIERHPEVFPNFYAVPAPQLDRQFLKELRDSFCTAGYDFVGY